ncbi:MAG: biopolymer transporter ExbD [Pirellulaceae bacterium]
MRLAKMRHRSAIAFNMTPMIDIVFLLIIFFMTVSQITRVAQNAIQLPMVPQSEDPEARRAVTLIINQQGFYEFNGEPKPLNELLTALAIERSRLKDNETLFIHLKCDKRTSTEALNRLLAELRRIEIHSVRMSVIQQ